MNNHIASYPPAVGVDALFGCEALTPDHDNGQRTLWLSEPVNPAVTQRVVETLLRFESAAPGVPIHFYISSPGGCGLSGLAIISTMQHISSPVYTYAIGSACSMGAVILAAGQPNHRYILPSSFVMIHPGHHEASGTLDNLRSTCAFQSKLDAEVVHILSVATGRMEEDVRASCQVDNWMDAGTAKSFGLVDQILEIHPSKIQDRP